MDLALSLGRRGFGATWPNPSVGCVIVAQGRIVGRATTAPGGRPHAEPQALAQAGPNARGATAYVTLEPCAHHGHTPPCAQALIEAGIARVVIAAPDPDPRVNGGGVALLRSAGLEVIENIRRSQAEKDLKGFLCRVTQGRPMLTLKLASSFDGRIATARGESQWITGPAARRYVHGLRATHDTVLVGGGTARADNPSLTVRGLGIQRQPVRIVASRGLDVPQSGILAQTARETPVWIAHGDDAGATSDWADLGVTLLPCATRGQGIDVVDMMQKFGDAGLTRVFCEGGGALAASLLAAGLVDVLVGVTAGLALGAEGQPSLGALGVEALADAPRFQLSHSRQIGADCLHVWRRA